MRNKFSLSVDQTIKTERERERKTRREKKREKKRQRESSERERERGKERETCDQITICLNHVQFCSVNNSMGNENTNKKQTTNFTYLLFV